MKYLRHHTLDVLLSQTHHTPHFLAALLLLAHCACQVGFAKRLQSLVHLNVVRLVAGLLRALRRLLLFSFSNVCRLLCCIDESSIKEALLDKEEGLEPCRPSVLMLAGSNEPDCHLDISKVMATKIRAVMAHSSQIGDRDEHAILQRYRNRAIEEARKHDREFDPERETDALVFRESFRLIRFD